MAHVHLFKKENLKDLSIDLIFSLKKLQDHR